MTVTCKSGVERREPRECLRRWMGVVLGMVCCAGALAQPAVFWASDPVRPGEMVLVIGEGLTEAQVSVSRLEDGPAGDPLGASGSAAGAAVSAPSIQPNNGSVKFVVPEGLAAGVFLYQIRTPAGVVEGLLNRPQVWWAQGEPGRALPVGGRVRVCGKNLLGAGSERATVVLQGPAPVRLAATGDEFALSLELPADLPEGQYKLYVHNGNGGVSGWSDPVEVQVARPYVWPQQVRSVQEFGAAGDGSVDDTEAVQAGLQAMEEAGGGVLYFPRGQYMLTAPLAVPRGVILRGEGRELTCLSWPDVQDAPPAQITGSGFFGIEDLTLYCSNYTRFLVGDSGSKAAGHIRLRRVTVRANRYRGHLTVEEVSRRLRTQESNQVPLLTFGGPDNEITDCDLYSSGMVFWLSGLRGALIARNTLSNGRWGWYSLSGSDGVILEGNRIVGGDLMATGGGLNCLDGSTFSQHVYYAGNTLTTMFGWDREAMTSDAGGGAYFGKVAAAEGSTVTLAEDPELGERDWRGAGLYVLDGRGAGQYRRVVHAQGRVVTLDRPWQVPPDETSTVTFCNYQGRCLFIGNDFVDAGVALQFYGNAVEHICARNRSTRTAGFHNFGMIYDRGIQPNWYLQWLDNEILEGNVYRGDHDNWRLSGEAHIGVYAFPPRTEWDVPLTLGTVLRRNRLHNNAHIMLGCEWTGNGFERNFRYVRDVVVENNEIARSRLGIFAYATAKSLALQGNRFEAVAQPLAGPGLAEAYVTATERAEGLVAGLQSLVTELGLQEDLREWPEVSAAVQAVAAAGEDSPEAAYRKGLVLRAVLARVAAARPEGLPLSRLARALGLSVRMPWECTAHQELQNRPGGGPAELDLIITASTDVGGPLPVSAWVDPPAGWESRESAVVELTSQQPAKVSIPLIIPAGAWAAHDLPVTLSLHVGDPPLLLRTIITAGSGYLRKWMLLGPFPNRTGADLDLTLLPPDDGVDLDGEYEGVTGKIRWQPWEDGDWLRFHDLCPGEQPVVAYAVACVTAPRAMPAELRVGGAASFSAMVNGQPVWLVERPTPVGPGHDRQRIELREGDNVLVFKLCSKPVDWTFVCELGPVRGGPPMDGVSVVSPHEFRGRPCFQVPQRVAPRVDEVRHSAGVNWQLVYADDFDRDTLGGRWRIGSGQWQPGGGMVRASGVAFLGYAQRIAAPVRIEYDTRVAGTVGGDLSAFWLRDPADYRSGWLVGFGSNGNTLNKVLINGAEVTTSSRPLVTPGKWHHVIAQILADGRVQLIVDDQVALDLVGTAPQEPLHPGLWSWNSDGIFARVRIFTGAPVEGAGD